MLPVSLLDFERQFLRATRQREKSEAVHLFDGELASIDPEAQLANYQAAVTLSFEEKLNTLYGVVRALVGDAFFDWAARAFIEQSEPTQADFMTYGANFPDFLADLPPVAQCPYVPDVARLAYAWHVAYHAENDPPFDFDALSLVPPLLQAEIVFHLPKSATLIESKYPVSRIWQVNQPDFQGEKTVDLNSGSETVFVWRDAGQPHQVILNHEQKSVMRLFAAALPFSEICDRLAQLDGMPSAAALLPHYIQSKWLASFSLPEEARGDHGW